MWRVADPHTEIVIPVGSMKSRRSVREIICIDPALNDFSVWKVATDTMEKRRIRTMSILISFEPAGLLHAPIVSIYECFLMLYNLSTYPQSIRIPSSNMFRKLTFPSSQVDCILSSK